MKHFYVNGIIYQGDQPTAEAFAEENGSFVFVGSSSDAYRQAEPEDRITDLKGRFVCAGFNDSHMHMLGYGKALGIAALDQHTGSLQEMIGYMRSFAEEHPVKEGRWIIGRGWNQDYFSDVHRMPDRHDLDQVSTEHPVCAVRACGHCLVVNTRAIELLGVTADTPVPEGGDIGIRDGVPDGRFYDNAIDLYVNPRIPNLSRAEIREALCAASKALNAYGVTSVQTDDYPEADSWRTVNEVFREMKEAGQLTVRVYEQCNFSRFDEFRTFVEEGNVTGAGDEWFRIGPLKLIGDGSLGSRTAFLSRSYADAPGVTGLPVFTQENMDAMIEYANDHGVQVAVHSIGDGSLDMVLHSVSRALEKTPRQDHRHGIVHCQISRADQLKKMAELNLHIYAQSIFLDYDSRIVEQRVGKELASTSYSWKTLKDSGLSVSNGTDCPVELPFALGGIQCAVTRTPLKGDLPPYLPEQAFSIREALDSYTIRGAEGSFEEQVKGRIEKGMLADFVILSENPLETEPEKIREIQVQETVLGGRTVFKAEN